jgi:Cu-Zn family superoxide dismutase
MKLPIPTKLLIPLLSVAIGLAGLNAVAEPGKPFEKESPMDAVAVLTPTQDNEVRGIFVLKQDVGMVHIKGNVQGLSPGKHGFHIHQFGDLRAADGGSAGGHHNPCGHQHGGPDDREHHAGDLGNIVANEMGVAVVDKKTKDFDLQSVIGRAIVVHGGADDLTSQPSGDAGPRVAVGIIGLANTEVTANL